jgi:hypothetical protein
MFGLGIVNQMMLPMAQGQPAPVAWSITQLARFIRPDVGVWNFFFGAVQLSIGVGMRFRRTVKPAIVAMTLWALGVWWFGAGFGMLLTGTASPLTGAPGAVLLYPLIGVLAWPTDAPARDVEPGIPSSAAASGPLGSSAPLIAWSGFWALSAVLWLFPANRAGDRSIRHLSPRRAASRRGTPMSRSRWPMRCPTAAPYCRGCWPCSRW